MASGSGASNLQWKAPSAAHQQKYSLQPLPEDFDPTEEEQKLLNFYDTIREYERQAARLKDAAARKRLADREAEFNKQKESESAPGEPSAKSKRKKKKKRHVEENDNDMNDNESEDESMDSAGSDEESNDDEHKSSYDRREEKLQALREEIEAKKKMGAMAEAEEDALRQELLTSSAVEEEGPLLKRKKIESTQNASLIDNISSLETPPHDFSKKLELSALHGTTRFLFLPMCLISASDAHLLPRFLTYISCFQQFFFC